MLREEERGVDIVSEEDVGEEGEENVGEEDCMAYI